MHIDVPAKLATKPAIVLAVSEALIRPGADLIPLKSHGCSDSGEVYATQTVYDTLSEQKGFIAVYPSTKRDSGCWGVNTSKGLSRSAGGDDQGLVSMVNYIIAKYSADTSTIFVTGSSSGCMMTNVLVATYPNVFVKHIANVFSLITAMIRFLLYSKYDHAGPRR